MVLKGNSTLTSLEKVLLIITGDPINIVFQFRAN